MHKEYIQNEFSVEYINPMDNIYRIEKPINEGGPLNATDLEWAMKTPEARRAFHEAQERYLPWQDFRKKSWATQDKEKIWTLIHFTRRFSNIASPIKDKSGESYRFDPNSHTEFLHRVDLELGGQFMGVSDFGEGDRRWIIRRNLIEESIASSKLEGANTSRDVAKRMLQEGRQPRDKHERMIVNNHAAMVRIESELKSEPLSLELLRDLHREVTRGTLSDSAHEGALRETLDRKGQRLKIMPWDETTVAYVTPDKGFVEEQLAQLFKFANEERAAPFIHPLFKAIMLHFWIGLLHPFEDGNGRLARLLFYWFMLRKGYWAFSYLSLSERILKSPKQYAMSFIYAEQDGFDLNYFIHYNVSKLKLARAQFDTYLKTKIAENRQFIRIVESGYNLNARQLRLLHYLAKDEDRYTSVTAHHNINPEIGYVTAASDLKKLIDEGFLIKRKTGRNVIYRPAPKIRTLLK